MSPAWFAHSEKSKLIRLGAGVSSDLLEDLAVRFILH